MTDFALIFFGFTWGLVTGVLISALRRPPVIEVHPPRIELKFETHQYEVEDDEADWWKRGGESDGGG